MVIADTGFWLALANRRDAFQALADLREPLISTWPVMTEACHLLADDLGHGRILSTDRRDFSAYRWKEHQPFENLLLGYC